MKKLIEANYKSIVKRGLINEDTSAMDFLLKIKEEVDEFKYEIYHFNDNGTSNENEELADIILTCLNFARHFNIDIEKELKNKIRKNETRKD